MPTTMHRQACNVAGMLLSTRFSKTYWRHMAKHFLHCVSTCSACPRFKCVTQPHDPMQVRLYERPFHTLGIDFVGELRKSPNGNKWIMTVVCPYSNLFMPFLFRISQPEQQQEPSLIMCYYFTVSHQFFRVTAVGNSLMLFCTNLPNYYQFNKYLPQVTDPDLVALLKGSIGS